MVEIVLDEFVVIDGVNELAVFFRNVRIKILLAGGGIGVGKVHVMDHVGGVGEDQIEMITARERLRGEYELTGDARDVNMTG